MDNMNGGMMKEDKSCASGSCGSCGGKGCKCMHHHGSAIMAVLIGVAFLGQGLGWIAEGSVAVAWPAFLIIGAVMKMTGGKCKCC